MNYDLIIPCHPKDYTKLEFCLNSCLEYLLPNPDNIYVVTPEKFQVEQIQCITDDEAIPIKKEDIKYRRNNWIYQQLIKLFQDFTKHDLYLCVDSDLIFNKPIDLFKDNKPNFFISDREQEHKPYFNFMYESYKLKKQTSYTFINDFMMFDKSICRELAPSLKPFLATCNQLLSEDCLLSEFELYGNYVKRYHHQAYNTQNTKTEMFGKPASQPWSKDEVLQHVQHMQNIDCDLFTIHSWT